MISALAGLIIALVVSGVALFKGRTGWHWFALSLLAFGAVWLLSIAGLYIANVRFSVHSADRLLASFSGILTCAIIFMVLLIVPARPRKSSGTRGVARGK